MSDDNTFSLGQGPFTLMRGMQPSEFVITGADEFKLRINADGTIDIGPGLKPDEAGRQAIDAMRHQMQWIIAAARNAALEEAAAEMEHREQVATTARDSYLKISSPEDAARHEHYRVAYGSGAAAIRELKDK